MRTKQKQNKVISEVGLMLVQIKVIFSKQKEAILLDMIGVYISNFCNSTAHSDINLKN